MQYLRVVQLRLPRVFQCRSDFVLLVNISGKRASRTNNSHSHLVCLSCLSLPTAVKMFLDFHGPPRQMQRVHPECRGRMNFFHHTLYGAHKVRYLLLAYHQRWCSFQHHEIVAAHLCEEVMFAEKLAHNDLSKHAFMYLAKRFKRDAKLPALRTPELNAIEHAQTAHFSHHLIARES